MTSRFVITGTDTGIGKTVFAAALAGALDGNYWKPVQAGRAGETDRETVRRLSGLPPNRMLPERYCLTMPASPHLAADRDGIQIETGKLVLPKTERPLIVEGAGGLLVPLTKRTLFIDIFARWGIPVVLCARTRLGTINHSLLSLEALRRRNIPVHGIVFIGEESAGVEETIAELGGVRRLGRLPHLPKLDAETLAAAFAANFRRSDFLAT